MRSSPTLERSRLLTPPARARGVTEPGRAAVATVDEESILRVAASGRRRSRCARSHWLGERWTSHASPRGDAEADTDQDRDRAPDPAPGGGVVRKDQKGDEPKVEPDHTAQNPQDPPARSGAGGEYAGDREDSRVLRIV